MGEPKTSFDDADEAIEAAAIARARSEIAAGEGVPHEVVGAWLRRLAAGETVPPPIPD
jgi:predicted transcriptional regulator